MLASGLVPQPRRLGFALVLESADVGARAAAHVALAGGRAAAAKLAALARAAAEGGSADAHHHADMETDTVAALAEVEALASARRQKAALC
jgi:hypothetical protein